MSERIAVVTDTTACIPRDLAEKYQIELVPVDLVFGDEVYQDGIEMSPAEFYARLRQADKLPTTSGSSPGPFLDAYRRVADRADHILCVTAPSKLSGMFNSAMLAVKMAYENKPDLIIKVIDSPTAAAGQGLAVLAAARVATSGKRWTEVVETIEQVMPKVKLFATLDTLHYLVKGGRVPRAAALASSLLKIKPIFTVNGGAALPVVNARTISGAMKRILKLMEQEVVQGHSLHVAVMHADVPEKAVTLKDKILARFHCDELFITEFTPVMGAHTGPGVIGVAFYNED